MTTQSDAQVEVTEYTDPVCSWAWGTEPKLRLLRWRFEHRMSWRRVMGGLVGDAGATRDDWDPVKAAELQGEDVAQRVLRRFRESIFVFVRPPGSTDQILESVRGVPGLDEDRLRSDLDDPAVADAYRSDWGETRRPNDFVRDLEGDRAGIGNMKHSEGHDRYAFPTLIFGGPSGEYTVPGWMDYGDYEAAMEAASPGSTADPRPDPTPEEAFERWPLLTPKELRVLCFEAPAPSGNGYESEWWTPSARKKNLRCGGWGSAFPCALTSMGRSEPASRSFVQ